MEVLGKECVSPQVFSSTVMTTTKLFHRKCEKSGKYFQIILTKFRHSLFQDVFKMQELIDNEQPRRRGSARSVR